MTRERERPPDAAAGPELNKFTVISRGGAGTVRAGDRRDDSKFEDKREESAQAAGLGLGLGLALWLKL